MEYVVNSLKGIKRTKNQDSYLVLNNEVTSLFIVFDGVSSYSDSHIFIQEYKNMIKKEFQKYRNNEVVLPEIFYETNQKLLNLGIQGYSTISMLVFNKRNSTVNFLNVGDSRIYNFTNTYLEKITIDNVLGERNNILTKFLGSDSLSIEDFELHNIKREGNYLLCTDGFYELLEDNLKRYFYIFNFKYLKNINKTLIKEQTGINNDDSTFLIIRT